MKNEKLLKKMTAELKEIPSGKEELVLEKIFDKWIAEYRAKTRIVNPKVIEDIFFKCWDKALLEKEKEKHK